MDRNGQSSSAPTLGEQARRVRDYWWLVAAVMALAVLAAIVSTMRTPTAYTARSASIVVSNNRSPDQDAVLVLGYVDYFNGAPYQDRLAAETKMPSGVTLTASTAAASPIVLIDAVAGSPAEAQTAASAAARAFRRDINRAHDQASSREIHYIRQDIAALQAGRSPEPGTGQATSPQARAAAITDLKNRILTIQADKTNVLTRLDQRGGVSASSPSLFKNVLFGLVGGAVVGVLLALFVSRLSPRVRSREDLAWKVGAETLVELPRPGRSTTAGEFRTGLRQLGNLVRARTTKPVVAVAEARSGEGASVVAWGLAEQWATRGKVAVLVRAHAGGGKRDEEGDRRPQQDGRDIAASRSVREAMKPGSVPGMWVLDEAACPADFADCLEDVLAEVASFATVAVVEAPPLLDVPDAQLVCAAAGGTVVVVQTGTATARDTADAFGVLERTGAAALGAVLVHTGRRGTTWDNAAASEAVGHVELQHASAT